MLVFLTGATGFVGRALIELLDKRGQHRLVAAVRRQPIDLPAGVRSELVGDLGADAQWQHALSDVEVVIHTAARVHVMDESVTDPLTEFRKVNVEGTLNLARQSAEAGVRRFIFISSIKVNGEGTTLGKPYTAEDKPAPMDPYGVSKKEAEDGLRKLASSSGMEVVIIRPPLVYGPGVKANFLSMMRWLVKGVPLPLGAIHNKRSLVALDNLVDLIVTCIDHPAAANQTLLAGDGEDLSTTELLRRMGKALGKPVLLMPVPAFLLSSAATVFCKRAFARRLLGSLQVDISKNQELLGWVPPVRVDDALATTARYFLENQNK